MKNTVYNFRPRIVVSQKPDLLSEKRNILGPPIQTLFIIFLWGFAQVFFLSVPTKFFFSWLCSLDVNKKNEKSSFSEHVENKLFLAFFLICTDAEKIKTISADTFVSFNKENMQN